MLPSSNSMADNAVIAALIVAVIVLAGIFVTPIALVGIPSYFAHRLYRDSPARHERIARQQTETLLDAVRAANVVLTDTEIERALLAEVPAKTPRPCRRSWPKLDAPSLPPRTSPSTFRHRRPCTIRSRVRATAT